MNRKTPLFLIVLSICMISGVSLHAQQETKIVEKKNEVQKKSNLDQSKNESQEESKPTLTVNVVNPVVKTIKENVQVNGNIIAREIATIVCQAVGVSLSRVYSEVGDVIAKGQLVAEYDDSMVRNAIDQAQANLMQAEVSYMQATAIVKRTQKLRKSKAISAMEFDNNVFKQKQTNVGVIAAKAQLENQLLRASYTKVTSRVSGRIIEKSAFLGAFASPGTPLYKVVVNDELEWQADVPDELLYQIKVGTLVNVRLDNNSDSPIIKGVVRRIDPVVDTNTQKGKVYVSMEKNPNLKIGLFVNGEFSLPQRQSLVVPMSSVIRKDGFDYVFIVDEENRAQRVKVFAGKMEGSEIAIIKGLKPSDRVVKIGAGFLNSGDLVKIAE